MTGNFTNWDGNIYPFVGWETLMVIVLVVAWVGWHIMQMRMENKLHDDDARMLRQGDNLHRAMAEEHTLERM